MRGRWWARSRRGAVALAVVLTLAVAGGGWLAWSRHSPAAAAPPVATATSGTVRQTVTATGTIQPAREADLSFPVAGTVTSVPVQVGDVVHAGQVVATVSTTALSAALQTAQASVAAAQAALTAAQASGATGVQLTSAQAQVAGALSKQSQAQAALASATLTTPIDGTVAAVTVSTGDQVGGSGGSGSAGGGSAAAASTAAVTVISTDAFLVQAGVGSADLAQVTRGLQAEITPTGSAQRVFGTVSSVGVMASSATGGAQATFPVVIAVTGTPSGLYAGASANVVIIVKQVPDVLTVPTAALHTTDQGIVVYVLRAGGQVTTPVTLGTTYGPSTQVVSGLRAGDQVVLPAAAAGRVRTGAGGGGAGGLGGGGGFGGGAGGLGGGGGFGGGAGGGGRGGAG